MLLLVLALLIGALATCVAFPVVAVIAIKEMIKED